MCFLKTLDIYNKPLNTIKLWSLVKSILYLAWLNRIPYLTQLQNLSLVLTWQQLQTNIASRIFDSSFDSDPVKPADQEEAPMESFFEACGGLNITNEIDRKIDEALALAQRLRNAGASAKPQPQPVAQAKDLGDDDLDMPAFLRNGNSDIALD